MRVGYIGLGNIGAPIADRVRTGGFPLAVWNRTPAKMEPFARDGVTTTLSAKHLAESCDILFLCIDSAEAIEAILFADGGVLCGTSRPGLIVDNSTMHPAFAQRLAGRLRANGIAMIDAPVSGGPAGARAGTLAVMVGGDPADVDRARPVIMTFAGRLTHMGPVGTGQAAKACNQIINFATLAGIAEALALASSCGIDSRLLLPALAGGLADSNMLNEYLRATAAGENDGVTFLINGLRHMFGGGLDPAYRLRLDILLKDLSIALDCARINGASLPVSTLLDSLFRTLHFQLISTTDPEEMIASVNETI